MKAEILPFASHHQPGIDVLLDRIRLEFEQNIFSPAYKKISELYDLPDRHYWVAVADYKIAGTTGIVVFENRFSVLKSMFVDKAYRGELQIAQRLLDTAIHRSKSLNCTDVYLGTMDQFKAAQRFYEKNGFTRIKEKDLPAEYPGNMMDTVFYRLKIANNG